jgi:TldD protein
VVDDEGVETRELSLLAEGRVRELITDSAWAARLRGRSSGRGRRAWDPDPVLPRLSRIGLSPGDDDPDDVVARGGDALYVESLSFGGLDARTGVVKLIVREARRSRTGRVHFGGFVEEPASALLSRIAAVGRDVEWHQSLCLKRRQITPAENGAPTMLLSPLQVRPAR